MSDEGYQAFNDFYSHAREGRDIMSDEGYQAFNDFYSHAREGRDLRRHRYMLISGLFLLTRPRGA